MRVKLIADLTRYDSRLTRGQEGNAGDFGATDNLVWVSFDAGPRIQVLWKSLEIIDAEHLAMAKASREKEEADVARATDVVLRLGPNGGFQDLSYRVDGPPKAYVCCGFRDKAERLMAIMRTNNVPIRVEKADRKRR